jgi:hypothetical protein
MTEVQADLYAKNSTTVRSHRRAPVARRNGEA